MIAKTLWHAFQSAAGIFQHLKGIVHSAVQQEPTPDLQPDTLTGLAALCVAQAQEVITVKAINGMSEASVSRSVLYVYCGDCSCGVLIKVNAT